MAGILNSIAIIVLGLAVICLTRRVRKLESDNDWGDYMGGQE